MPVIRLFVRACVRSLVRSFVYSFVCSFVRSFVCLFVCSFVRSLSDNGLTGKGKAASKLPAHSKEGTRAFGPS